MESLKDGIGMARTLFGQSAFEDMVGKEVFPGEDQTEVRFAVHTLRSPFPITALIAHVPNSVNSPSSRLHDTLFFAQR